MKTDSSIDAQQPVTTYRDRLVRNASAGLRAMTIVIGAPSGVGKSTQALFLSRHCPDELKVVPPGTPLKTMDDVFVVSTDKDGMLCGLPYGLDARGLPVLDARYELGTDVTKPDGSIVRELMSMRQFSREVMFPMLQEEYRLGCRNFVFDTLTTAMTATQPEIERETSMGGSRNNMEYYPKLTAFGQEIYAASACLPGATILYLVHTAYKDDFVIAEKGESKQAAEDRIRQKKQATDPYLARITPVMPGKTAEVFINQASLVLSLDLYLDIKGGYKRRFIVHPGQEHRAKNRLAEWLDPIEYGSIRTVLNKIKTAAGII